MRDNNILVFSLAETWLSSDIKTSELFIPDFKIHRIDRSTRGGGIVILVTNKIYSSIENSIMTENLELLHISINRSKARPLQFITVYRPPSCTVGNFIDCLEIFLNNVELVVNPIIIIGDFNIDILKNSAQTRKFKSVVKNYGLTICNHEPTRVTSQSSTLIDILLGNEKASQYIKTLKTNDISFSDHRSITMRYKKVKIIESKPRMCHILSEKSVNDFKTKLETPNMNYDVKYDEFVDNTLSIIENGFQLRRMHVRSEISCTEWHTTNVKQLAKSRDDAHKIAKRTNDQNDVKKFQQVRNNCNKELKLAKSNFFQKKILKLV